MRKRQAPENRCAGDSHRGNWRDELTTYIVPSDESMGPDLEETVWPSGNRNTIDTAKVSMLICSCQINKIERIDHMNQARIALAALTQIIEPGESVASALIAIVGPEATLEAIAGTAPLSPADTAAAEQRAGMIDASVSPDVTHALLRYSTRTESKTLASLHADGERFLAQIEKLGGGLLIPEDDSWPSQVNDLPVPPIGLWYRGDISQGIPSTQKAIAFDGSRDSTAYGAAVTGEFAYSAAQSGISVVTGAGYGVASHALRAAMAGSTGNVAVIAALACGVDRFYPAGNTDLLQAVAQHGLVLSELAPGMAPTRYRFLSRNRVLAALEIGRAHV